MHFFVHFCAAQLNLLTFTLETSDFCNSKILHFFRQFFKDVILHFAFLEISVHRKNRAAEKNISADCFVNFVCTFLWTLWKICALFWKSAFNRELSRDGVIYQ